MLKYFNAALSKLGRTQPFNHLASMAALALDAAAVTIVDVTPVPTIVGCSDAAGGIPQEVVDLAASIPPFDPVLTRVPLHTGAALPFDPPFANVVNLAMVAGARHVLCMVFPLPSGLDTRRLTSFLDIGRRQVAETALTQRYRNDLKRYITMFDHMERTAKIGLWEFSLADKQLFWSDELFRIHERPIGTVPSIRAALDYFPEPGRQRLRDMLRETQANGTPCDLTLPFVTEAGRKRMVRLIASLERGSDPGERIIGVFQDVTQMQEATERLWWTANHDTLTGLPNRALFADRFRKALERRRRTEKLVCLVLVDVDRFKEVNDTLGHAAGDELLRLVAARLRDNVRVNDTVARTGGDEFSVLVEDIASHEALEAVLARLRGALEVRLVWEERTMLVTLSAGAALAPAHGASEHELICAADLALYKMKEEPQAALALYEPAFGRAQQEKNQLLVAARMALAEGQIVPWYQPQVDIASGRIVGVEALARWVTPERVRVAGEFSAALRDHELGTQIGNVVVDQAITALAQLNKSRERKISLAINASAGELMRASFLQRIGRKCLERGEGAGPITVEITEEVVLDDPTGKLSEEMRIASENGLRFSLDDFGTGYASLIHISTLPISEVKVDRRFIIGLETDEAKQKIIRGIIDVARSLDLRLIIEGVETQDQVRRITELGGRFAQGFYYSRAVPLDELKAMLAAEDAELECAVGAL